jgi:hypothetical protein
MSEVKCDAYLISERTINRNTLLSDSWNLNIALEYHNDNIYQLWCRYFKSQSALRAMHNYLDSEHEQSVAKISSEIKSNLNK